jgi:hypothetical protein
MECIPISLTNQVRHSFTGPIESGMRRTLKLSFVRQPGKPTNSADDSQLNNVSGINGSDLPILWRARSGALEWSGQSLISSVIIN